MKINYNNCDKDYVDELSEYFYKYCKDIYSFFSIQKLSKNLVINIIDDMNKFVANNETSVANTDSDENNYYINILSYKELIKRKTHETNKLSDMYKLLIHEFVHICHKEINTYDTSLIWVREGIAIVLSNQYGNISYKINNCDIDDLLKNNRTWYINYYTMTKYTIQKYGMNYLKKLVFEPSLQIKVTTNIFNELKNENILQQ